MRIIRLSQLLLAFFLLNITSLSAKEKNVSLTPARIDEPLSFYIQKVVDAREYNKSIGLKLNQNTNEFDYYNFEASLEDEVKKYFDLSVSKIDRDPVIMEVKYLFTSYKSKKDSWTKLRVDIRQPDSPEDVKFSITAYGYSIESALNKALFSYQLFLKYPAETDKSAESSGSTNTVKRRKNLSSYLSIETILQPDTNERTPYKGPITDSLPKEVLRGSHCRKRI